MLSAVRQRCLTTKPNRFVTSWNQNYTTSLWFCPHQPSHLLSSTARFESLRTLQQREFLWGAREIKNLRFEVRDERRSLRTSTFPNPMFILVVIAQSLVEAVAALQNGFYSQTIQLKVQPFFFKQLQKQIFFASLDLNGIYLTLFSLLRSQRSRLDEPGPDCHRCIRQLSTRFKWCCVASLIETFLWLLFNNLNNKVNYFYVITLITNQFTARCISWFYHKGPGMTIKTLMKGIRHRLEIKHQW